MRNKNRILKNIYFNIYFIVVYFDSFKILFGKPRGIDSCQWMVIG